MFDDLQDSPYVRIADDTIPGESMFAYKYLQDHLLSFVLEELPLSMMKRVLRDALRGVAAMHEKGIVHTDIKANNILVEWNEQRKGGEIVVEQVKIADIEDAAYVPEDSVIRGQQLENCTWRSSEAHASTDIHTLSDVFSFGLVVRIPPFTPFSSI
jgi:serine/threonine protein kinase